MCPNMFKQIQDSYSFLSSCPFFSEAYLLYKLQASHKWQSGQIEQKWTKQNENIFIFHQKKWHQTKVYLVSWVTTESQLDYLMLQTNSKKVLDSWQRLKLNNHNNTTANLSETQQNRNDCIYFSASTQGVLCSEVILL